MTRITPYIPTFSQLAIIHILRREELHSHHPFGLKTHSLLSHIQRKKKKNNVYTKCTLTTADTLSLYLPPCTYEKMPGPYKEHSTQSTTQPEHAKPNHQTSDRDQKNQTTAQGQSIQG